MAAARSVIVRFTSSSTSTAAPAAARLASLRQRVLQARSGVVKNPSNSEKGGARGRHCSLFRRRVDLRQHTNRLEHHARPAPPFAPTARRLQKTRKRARSPRSDGPPPSRHHAPPRRRSPPPSMAPTRSRATSPRRTASRTPPCASTGRAGRSRATPPSARASRPKNRRSSRRAWPSRGRRPRPTGPIREPRRPPPNRASGGARLMMIN